MTKAEPKRRGRPPIPQEHRAEPTRPYSVRLTAAEIAELKRRRVRGPGSLAEWLAGSFIRSRKEAADLVNMQFGDDGLTRDKEYSCALHCYQTALYGRKKEGRVGYGKQELRDLLDFIYGGDPSSGEEISPGIKFVPKE